MYGSSRIAVAEIFSSKRATRVSQVTVYESVLC